MSKYIFFLNNNTYSNKKGTFNKITKKHDAVRRCTNEGYDCEKIAIEKIKHFISKDAMNIDGLGKKVVENFWDLNLIRLPQDIYNLDYKKISNLEGWGELSISNLKRAILNSQTINLDKLELNKKIQDILYFRNIKTKLTFGDKLLKLDLKSNYSLLDENNGEPDKNTINLRGGIDSWAKTVDNEMAVY